MVPETYFTIGEELWLFFYSMIFGVLSGVFYDVFRAIRSVFKHRFFAVFIEDCIFFAIYSLALMCFAAAFSRSQVRAYYALGNLIGFALYHFTLGNIILAVIRKAVYLLKKTCQALWHTVSKIAQKIAEKIVKNAENVRIGKKMNTNILQNGKAMVYNKKSRLFDSAKKRRSSAIYNTDNKNKRDAKVRNGEVWRKEKG